MLHEKSYGYHLTEHDDEVSSLDFQASPENNNELENHTIQPAELGKTASMTQKQPQPQQILPIKITVHNEADNNDDDEEEGGGYSEFTHQNSQNENALICSVSNYSESRSVGAAPKLVVEKIRIGKPKKVLSLLANAFGMIFLFLATASTSWMHTDLARIGLWEECFEVPDYVLNATEFQRQFTLDLTVVPRKACNWNPCKRMHARIFSAFCLCGTLFSFFACTLFGYAMTLYSMYWKFRMYNANLVLNALAVVLFITSLIGYPMSYLLNVAYKKPDTAMMDDGDQTESASAMKFYHFHGNSWSLGWAFVIGWLGCLILIISGILLFLDRHSEEIMYRERIKKVDSR